MFITREDLTQQWSQVCTTESTQELLTKQLAAPGFFEAYAHVGFSKATREDTGRHQIVLDIHAAEQIQEELEQQLGVALPAPESACAYKGAEQVQITDVQSYYKVLNAISKANKAAKRQGRLQEATALLDRARQLVGPGISPEPPFTMCLSLDVEWWELDKELVLELGWSLWDTATGKHRTRHWQVQENMGKSNGRHVPDNRHRFLFAPRGRRSKLGSCEEAVAALQAEIDARGLLLLPEDEPECKEVLAQVSPKEVVFILVGHGMATDLRQCEELGLVLPQQLQTMDTQALAWAAAALSDAPAAAAVGSSSSSSSGLDGSASNEAGASGSGADSCGKNTGTGGNGGAGPPGMNSHQVALKALLERLGIKPLRLHNAGNDARFTMEAFLALAGRPVCPDPAGAHAAACGSVPGPAAAAAKSNLPPPPQPVVAGWGPPVMASEAGTDGWN